MIEFDPRKYPRKNRTCYIGALEIERLTGLILEDYNHELLDYPQGIDYEDFLINYLNADVKYEHIYPEKNDEVVLGCTAFNKTLLDVFDRDNMCRSQIELNPRDIVLDKSLVDGDRKVQETITGLHEGGHLWIHPSYYTIPQNQIAFKEALGTVKCNRAAVNNYYKADDAEWRREWQATTFAVTLALPRKSFSIAVEDVFRKYGIKDFFIIEEDFYSNQLAKQIITGELQKIYPMSKEALFYRLKGLGCLITRRDYDIKGAQMTLYDL